MNVLEDAEEISTALPFGVHEPAEVRQLVSDQLHEDDKPVRVIRQRLTMNEDVRSLDMRPHTAIVSVADFMWTPGFGFLTPSMAER